MSARTMTSRAAWLGILLAALLLSACGGGATKATTGTPPASPAAQLPTPIQGSLKPTATPVPPGPAPSPAAVDYAGVKLIPDWQGLGVPQYPGAKKLSYQATAGSSVTNAGTMLFSTSDPPEKVLAYYLGALPLSGYQLKTANSLQILEVSSKADVAVNAVKASGGTQIIVVVTDPTG